MIMKKLKEQSGFTLIEMLLVVILLGILALAIIPQISVSSDDAKLSTLKTNLNTVRNALELYYHQHNEAFPGGAVPGTKPADVTDIAEAFAAQLSRYTDVNGNISNTHDDVTYKFGPYLKHSLPYNTFNDKNDIVIDTTEPDITVRDSTATDNGWKFYYKTGVYIAADGTTGDHDDL